MFKPFSYFVNDPSKVVILDFFVICDLCLTVPSGLFLVALWVARKGLTSWLSFMRCFLVLMSLSHMVSLVRYSTLFVIFAFFLLCVSLVLQSS